MPRSHHSSRRRRTSRSAGERPRTPYYMAPEVIEGAVKQLQVSENENIDLYESLPAKKTIFISSSAVFSIQKRHTLSPTRTPRGGTPPLLERILSFNQ